MRDLIKLVSDYSWATLGTFIMLVVIIYVISDAIGGIIERGKKK
jgi:hypothetical protein